MPKEFDKGSGVPAGNDVPPQRSAGGDLTRADDKPSPPPAMNVPPLRGIGGELKKEEIHSPLGFAKEVQQLSQMPGHLCKQRGICCRVATFKGMSNVAEVRKLAADPEAHGHEQARGFLSIFVPYETQAEVRAIADEFVDRARTLGEEKGKDPDKITFFHCKYVLQDGRCGVHEDRPEGCRRYPFPYKTMLFHPGCGYEQQAHANWARIAEIMKLLGMDPDSV